MFQVWYGNRLREKMNFGSGRRQKDFYIKRSLQSTEINSFQNRERISSHWLFLITLIFHVPTCGITPLFVNKSISGHQLLSCLPKKDLLLQAPAFEHRYYDLTSFHQSLLSEMSILYTRKYVRMSRSKV